MDGLDLLIQDHRALRDELAAARRPGAPDSATVNRLVRDVSVHDAVERAHLYPVVAVRLDGGKDRVDRSVEEHGAVARDLAELDRRDEDDEHRAALLGSLASNLARHMDEEEREVFPALRARLAPEELEELGEHLATARHRAPTRPHPHSAGSGAGARLGAGVLGRLDRTRDWLAGRRVTARPAGRSQGGSGSGGAAPEAARAPGRVDLFAAVSRQHREIERLLGGLLGDPEVPDLDDIGRRRLVEHLVAASARHEVSEELVLWPTVRRRVPGGDALAEEALGQERDGRYGLDTLQVAKFDGQWLGLAREVAEGIWAHIAFEEQKVWPELRPQVGRVRGALLGRAFLRAGGVALTRPHPHGPDRPAGLTTAGLPGAGLDRVRDWMAGRR